MSALGRALLIAGLAGAVLTGCRTSEFGTLCNAVSAQPGVHRQYIPMLGIARIGVRMAHPAGVFDFKLAVFENGGMHRSPAVDRALSSIDQRGWTPVVKVRSADGTRTRIWLRESPRGMEMLLFAHETGESVVLQLEMDAETLFARLAADPAGAGRRTLAGLGD
ncbi:MAG TPA: hypothetical protein VMS56_14850 [Thermoanaerobaculia bacterium]|nr:hypothetical protein [Thermoanaerobaculia bacterium]